MPDISRSDSNRSDSSRPRVSFNRDVHVKRINGPRTANAYSVSSDGTSFVPTSIRRERPKTKRQMTKEAEVVLKQVDKLNCTASSNVKLDPEKPKVRKKRKESFLSFNRKNDKSKNSSSDFDSASSQEYRVYKVNNKDEPKPNNFMSLDRKKLKKNNKNNNLEYLSLERDSESFEKILKEKKEKTNKNIMTMMLDKFDSKTKRIDSKPKPKIICDISEDKLVKKKQLSPIIESPGVDYFDGKKQNNIDKMIKKLTEKRIPKLNKNTGMVSAKAPQNDTCHNENKPFSYINGMTDKSDIGLKLDGAITESLDGKEDLKSASPTSDVIYAQVVVSGRDGNVQKTTVHTRVPSHEVGRDVGESNQSQVGLDYKIESSCDDGIYETVTVDSDEMWKRKSDFLGKKEKFESFTSPQTELYGENPGRRDLYRRKSIDSDRKTPSPFYDNYTTRIRVAPKYDPVKRSRSYEKSPSDLHDLSIRREILLSRSESQAKERYNSLKRLQEPTAARRKVSEVNGFKKPIRNELRYLGNDTKVNDKFSTSLRKIPKDVELIEPRRSKRESHVDNYLKEKEERWKNNEKVHSLKTGNENNLLHKLSKIGKSKSFIEEKPRMKNLDKVKLLFRKKKDEKNSESEDDPLASRYIEYRGSDIDLSDRSSSPRRNNLSSELGVSEPGYPGRKRLPTPTSSRNSYDSMGTLTRIKNNKNKESHWLKSLDRLTKKGRTPRNKIDDVGSELSTSSKRTNLRFFGDTDQESTNNGPRLSDLKLKYGLHRAGKISDSEDEPLIIPSRSESRMTDSTLKGSTSGKYKSKYDLDRPDYGLKQMNYGLNVNSNRNDYLGSNLSDTSTLKNCNYDFNLNGMKYGPNISRSLSSVSHSSRYGSKEKLRNLKSTPIITVTQPEESLSRRVRSHGNLYNQDDNRRVRRRLYDSSAESTTEGDSSQHSAKSMIYLHAATVGDIPGPKNVYRSERRSQSREELSSIGDSTILAPSKKTLSRSISVLAPWRPKHFKEDRSLHYDSANGSEFGRGKPPTGPVKPPRSLSRERKPSELRFNTLGKENRRQKDLLR